MTVEVCAVPAVEQPITAEAVVAPEKCEKDESKPKTIEKSSSYREESNFLSDLKEHEKKALIELKTKLEDAILGNTLFNNKEEKKTATPKKPECAEEIEGDEEKKKTDDVAIPEEKTPNSSECEPEEKQKQPEPDSIVEIDREISIWGVPILPSKGDPKTDVVLLKFLRAREFKINDAFEMLRKTLAWRKEFRIDSILGEEFGAELGSAAYMSGADRHGHPICYNLFGVLENEALGSEEKREQFLRWRVQLMERGVEKLDFKADGVNSLVQINDLRNLPGPSKKEVRAAVDKAFALLQDNYPEFVAKNICINVPFWYFAYHSLVSPFLTQRTRSKLVFARPSKVTETLLKYIPIQEIPVQYGGIKIENDFEFSVSDEEPTEIVIKAGSTETIEIPTPESGTTFVWDLIVLGWEVKYTEEFVPANENSYTLLIQKGTKMSSGEAPVRKTFKNHEAGKIVLTVQNCSGKKKKLFYRCKVKKASC